MDSLTCTERTKAAGKLLPTVMPPNLSQPTQEYLTRFRGSFRARVTDLETGLAQISQVEENILTFLDDFRDKVDHHKIALEEHKAHMLPIAK